MADQFMGRPFYSCRNCLTPLAFQEDILSKDFLTKSGPGYMFEHAMNVVLGKKQERKLMTGGFTIANINCSNCGETLGWKYVKAYDIQQKYKEGKFILEKLKMVKNY